ncbi:UNVERIFIED_CONTAM: hypothetical protein GTU68_002109 [Idotea baltica]|nr:hypothetical protein [Idotea baltica]
MDRSLQIVVENPTQTRYVMKFVPTKNYFILKVTDGRKICMKKANAIKEY